MDALTQQNAGLKHHESLGYHQIMSGSHSWDFLTSCNPPTWCFYLSISNCFDLWLLFRNHKDFMKMSPCCNMELGQPEFQFLGCGNPYLAQEKTISCILWGKLGFISTVPMKYTLFVILYFVGFVLLLIDS